MGGSSEEWLQHFPDLYGYQGRNPLNPGVFLLSPWEFLMWWEIAPLSSPASCSHGLTHAEASTWTMNENAETDY
eukprot:9914337-Karenia_brevis.AAC.1